MPTETINGTLADLVSKEMIEQALACLPDKHGVRPRPPVDLGSLFDGIKIAARIDQGTHQRIDIRSHPGGHLCDGGDYFAVALAGWGSDGAARGTRSRHGQDRRDPFNTRKPNGTGGRTDPSRGCSRRIDGGMAVFSRRTP